MTLLIKKSRNKLLNIQNLWLAKVSIIFNKQGEEKRLNITTAFCLVEKKMGKYYNVLNGNPVFMKSKKNEDKMDFMKFNTPYITELVELSNYIYISDDGYIYTKDLSVLLTMINGVEQFNELFNE